MLIKQRTLDDLAARRRHVAELKREIAQLETENIRDEEIIITLLDTHAMLERGALSAGVYTESRRIPKWKSVVAEKLGPEVVQQVMEETAPTVYRRLVILRGTEVVE